MQNSLSEGDELNKEPWNPIGQVQTMVVPPKISRKMRRRAMAFVTKLNPFKKATVELLPFEKPLADLDRRIQEVRSQVEDTEGNVKEQIEATQAIQALEKRALQLRRETFERLTPEQRCQVATHPARPTARHYMTNICSKFLELHIDGAEYDDHVLVCGVGEIDGINCMLIGHQKGWQAQEAQHFKETRMLMQEAETFGFPIVSFIETHASAADAAAGGVPEDTRIDELMGLRVPMLRVVTGMCSSTTPAASTLGDTNLMMQNAVYFHATKTQPGAEPAPSRQLTPEVAVRLGLIEEVLPEPSGAAHRNAEATYSVVLAAVVHHLKELQKLELDELIKQRRAKYHRRVKIGVTDEDLAAAKKGVEGKQKTVGEWMEKLLGSSET